MRRWLYKQLHTYPPLVEYFEPLLGDDEAVSNRVYQGESLQDSLTPKPYLFYTLGNSTDEGLSETKRPYRQFFTIFIHDEPADYQRIDDLVKLVKEALQNGNDAEEGIITINHLETSRDLDDSTLGTILRYVRFQAIKES